MDVTFSMSSPSSETYEDADRERQLRITVELAPGREAGPGRLAASIRDQLLRLNSEFANYVPAERQLPEVVLRPTGDPEYFPVRDQTHSPERLLDDPWPPRHWFKRRSGPRSNQALVRATGRRY